MTESMAVRVTRNPRRRIAGWVAVAILVVAAALGATPAQAGAKTRLTATQRATLRTIAADTWRFYASDVDPVTHLPLDNLGPGSVRGQYTSSANIGVYLWAVIAAKDLGLITPARATSLARATLNEVSTLKRFDGFLYQWYDTSNG